MKNAQNADRVHLSSLIEDLNKGHYVIPDFQRETVWEPGDVRDLMRSIFSDYYIGSLLLWKANQKNISSLQCENIYGHKGKSTKRHIVLDGQQRLTAIYYAFLSPEKNFPNKAHRYTFFINIQKFINEQIDDAFDYEWMTKKNLELFNSKEYLFERHLLPLNVVGQGVYPFIKWLEEYEKFHNEKIEKRPNKRDKNIESFLPNLGKFRDEVCETLQKYQVSFIELNEDIGVDKVCDIFAQLNSKGSPLSVFDLLNALMKRNGLQLKHMFREVKEKLSFVDTKRMNVYILQVMSILKQDYCSSKYLYYLQPNVVKSVRLPDGSFGQETLVKSESEFRNLWDDSVCSLEKAIKILRHPNEYGVVDRKYLPYPSILPAFASISRSVANFSVESHLKSAYKIRLWYWASVFGNRYSSAVESTTAHDFKAMQEWLRKDEQEPEFVREFKNTYREIDLVRETKKNSAIYRAIFNILIMSGAKDWLEGEAISSGDIDDHHIIPKSWGKENRVEHLCDSILNRTPLLSRSNRAVIGDKLPNEYIPRLLEENDSGILKKIFYSHYIDSSAFSILQREPFTVEDFNEFLSKRSDSIFKGLDKIIFDDSNISSTEEKSDTISIEKNVKETELKIRNFINFILKGDVKSIPGHFLGNEKILQRIRASYLKGGSNVTIEKVSDVALGEFLEFLDLMELEEIVTSKKLWGDFEEFFERKDILTNKFIQLSELRNALAHSRNLNSIIKKEGEAAIEWFGGLLKNSE